MPLDRTLEARWERIRISMERNRALLEHQGKIVLKSVGRTSVHVLRFVDRQHGRRIQRSVYLGRELELVWRTRALLEAFREPQRWQAEVAAATAALGSIVSRLRRRFGRRGRL
jgi:hypothetical protein